MRGPHSSYQKFGKREKKEIRYLIARRLERDRERIEQSYKLGQLREHQCQLLGGLFWISRRWDGMARKKDAKKKRPSVGRSSVKRIFSFSFFLSITLIDSHPLSPRPFYTDNHPHHPYSAPSPSTSSVSHVYASFLLSVAESHASSPELPATRCTPP